MEAIIIDKGTLNYFMSLVSEDIRRDTQERESILLCNGYRDNAATDVLLDGIKQHTEKFNQIMPLVDSDQMSVIVVIEGK